MKKKQLLTIILVCIINSSFGQDKNFSAVFIPKEFIENANSIIRKYNYSIEVKSQKSLVIRVEKIITIFNKYGDKYSDLTLSYDNKRSINSVKMYVYDAFGNEIKKIKKGDFNDYSASDGFSLYNDGRLIHYDYIPTTYPYTIHQTYEIQSSNTGFMQSWTPLSGYAQTIEHAKFSVKHPEDINLKYHEFNFEGFDIKKKVSDTQLVYQLDSLMA